jgi:uncharacterized protein YecT (DUF1311 family)
MRRIAILLGILISGTCFSESCANALIQSEIDICVEGEAKRLTDLARTLDEDIQQNIDHPNPEAVPLLFENWLKLRNAECNWEAGLFEGGSIRPTIYFGCLASWARERILRRAVILCDGAGMTGECNESRKYTNEI